MNGINMSTSAERDRALAAKAREIESVEFPEPDELLAQAAALAERAREFEYLPVRCRLVSGQGTHAEWGGDSVADFDLAADLFHECDRLLWCEELVDHRGSWMAYLASRAGRYSVDAEGNRVTWLPNVFKSTSDALTAILKANGHDTVKRRGKGTKTAQRDQEATGLESKWKEHCKETEGRPTIAGFAEKIGMPAEHVRMVLRRLRQNRRAKST